MPSERRLTGGAVRAAHGRAGATAQAAVAAAVLLAVGSVALPQQSFHRDDDWVSLVLTAACAVPLLWWRRMPVPAAAVATVAGLAGPSLGYATNLGTYCAIGCIAALAYAGRPRPALLLSGAAVVVAVAVSVQVAQQDRTGYTLDLLTLPLMVIVAPVAYVAALRGHRVRGDRLREQAAQALERSVVDAREAVAAERIRIAREVHDIVGHHLSAIRVQAAAARAVPDPDRAQQALGDIAEVASLALAQTREVLGRTRDGAAEGTAPAGWRTGLVDLPALLESVRATGTEVGLTVRGDPRAYPPAVEDAAYRIVQESLTNVLRHAAPRRAEIEVEHGDGALTLVVHDEGTAAGAAGDGWGLRGMSERAALLGGSLAAGPRDEGAGWQVVARLPVPVPATGRRR